MKSWLIVVLFIGVCLLPLKAKAEYDLGKYFPLDQGNVWVYKTVYSGDEDTGEFEERAWIDGAEAINGQDAVKMFTEITGGAAGFIINSGCDYLAIDSEGIKLLQYQGRKVDPSALVFPAQIGTGGVVESSYTIAANDDPENPAEPKHNSKKITLEGIEDVGIKAGEFKDCLKFSIDIVQVLDSGRKSIENSKIWLAQNVGMIKEITSTKYIESDGASREKFTEKELKGAVVSGEKVGEEVKIEKSDGAEGAVVSEEKAGEEAESGK